MTPLVENALALTPDEVEQASQKARARNELRTEAKLPAIPHEQALTEALDEIEGDKRALVFGHVKARLSRRYHRRIERMIEKKTGESFRLNAYSGMAFQDRWAVAQARFVEKTLRPHYRGAPIPLDKLRALYGRGTALSQSAE